MWSERAGRWGWIGRAVLLVALVVVAWGCGEEESPQRAWRVAWEGADRAGWLMSVAGGFGRDVWAVGGAPEDGVVLNFNGERWEEQEIPDEIPLVNWVHVLADGTPVMACNEGYVMWRQGGEWRRRETPTDENLWGIWGTSLEDLWAVGGSGREGSEAVVLRNVSGPWEVVEVPELERPGVRAFFKVWGSGPEDVYIVGQRGAMLRWDGEVFEEVGLGVSQDLISVWGTGPEDVVVVGGRANGVVARWDGESWESRALAPVPGLSGVWTGDEEYAWAVGVSGAAVRIDKASLEAEFQSTPTGRELHGVWSADGGTIWGVGGTLGQPEPYRGVLLRNRVE